MRDGKRLFTAIHVPRDATAGPYPFLMDCTPYSVGLCGEDEDPKHLRPSEKFQKSGYIFVYQDERARWTSEGDYLERKTKQVLLSTIAESRAVSQHSSDLTCGKDRAA
jgi:predicted acyl esterase